jgi:superfamily II DNA or RNA helicase
VASPAPATPQARTSGFASLAGRAPAPRPPPPAHPPAHPLVPPITGTPIVRYVGALHPHLTGLEGRVITSASGKATVQWRRPGGGVRLGDRQDPASYAFAELVVLPEGYSEGFKNAAERERATAPAPSVRPPSARPASSRGPSSREARDPFAEENPREAIVRYMGAEPYLRQLEGRVAQRIGHEILVLWRQRGGARYALRAGEPRYVPFKALRVLHGYSPDFRRPGETWPDSQSARGDIPYLTALFAALGDERLAEDAYTAFLGARQWGWLDNKIKIRRVKLALDNSIGEGERSDRALQALAGVDAEGMKWKVGARVTLGARGAYRGRSGTVIAISPFPRYDSREVEIDPEPGDPGKIVEEVRVEDLVNGPLAPATGRAQSAVGGVAAVAPPAAAPEPPVVPPPSLHEEPAPVAAAPTPVVGSIQALRALPVGTRLRQVKNVLGTVERGGGRRIEAQKPKGIVLRVDAPGTKHHGATSDITFSNLGSVEPRPHGFALLDRSKRFLAEYVVEEIPHGAASPAPADDLRARIVAFLQGNPESQMAVIARAVGGPDKPGQDAVFAELRAMRGEDVICHEPKDGRGKVCSLKAAPAATAPAAPPTPTMPGQPRAHHVAIYGGKEVVVDYVPDPRREFSVAAMRVNDNLPTGKTGLVVTPKGQYFLITEGKRTSQLIAPGDVPTALAKHLPGTTMLPAKAAEARADQETPGAAAVSTPQRAAEVLRANLAPRFAGHYLDITAERGVGITVAKTAPHERLGIPSSSLPYSMSIAPSQYATNVQWRDLTVKFTGGDDQKEALEAAGLTVIRRSSDMTPEAAVAKVLAWPGWETLVGIYSAGNQAPEPAHTAPAAPFNPLVVVHVGDTPKHPKWAAIREALRDPGPENRALAATLIEEVNKDRQAAIRRQMARAAMEHNRARLEVAGLTVGEPLARVMAKWIGEGVPTPQDLDAWIAEAGPWTPEPPLPKPAAPAWDPARKEKNLRPGMRLVLERGVHENKRTFLSMEPHVPRAAAPQKKRKKGDAPPPPSQHAARWNFVFRIDDIGPKYGALERIDDVTVVWGPRGFKLVNAAEVYVFGVDATEAAPPSVGTLRATLTEEHRKARVASEVYHKDQAGDWLHHVRSILRTAEAGRAEDKALRDVEDALALQQAPSPRTLDPLRLGRLIEAMEDAQDYEGLRETLIEARELGAHGAPSGQAALFVEASAIGDELGRLNRIKFDPLREKVRKAVALARAHVDRKGPAYAQARDALKAAIAAYRARRPAQAPALPPAEQHAAALVEHQAEALSRKFEEKPPCATEEGVLAATAGEYRTVEEVSGLLGGCDPDLVQKVLTKLADEFKLRKTFTKDKPTRWGHDVPPHREDWAVYRRGADIYGDTSFLTASGQLPGFSVKHLGMGEFVLNTPRGEVEFDRMRGVDFPGQTGRSHLLYATQNPEALALLLKEMRVDERLAEEAAQQPAATAAQQPATLTAQQPATPAAQQPAAGAPASEQAGRPGSAREAAAAPHRLTMAEKAADLWAAFTPSERAAVAAGGIFPAKPMEQAAREGYAGRELTVALMDHAKQQKSAERQAPHGKPEGRPDRVRAALQETSQRVEAARKPTTEAVSSAAGEARAIQAAEDAGTVSPAAMAGVKLSSPPNPDDEAVSDIYAPVEHRTAAARRDANIKAMWLASDLEARPRPLTNDDRLVLAAYSDWGGLGIEKAARKFPPGFPVPEKRQLIHAYFTPPFVCSEIARVTRPLIAGLDGKEEGRIHALEPSLGIGRFPLAFSGPGFEALSWHGVEYSKLSFKMVRALRPDMDLYQGPFESWVTEKGPEFQGRLRLVVSNPPYGERGPAYTKDPDRSYREIRADNYFLRRGLDLLGAGGLGIYIIPSGFLTGKTADARKIREQVLRRHHLSAAFRLPNEVFSLANVVTDILFFRARGGILEKVDEADQFILDGKYYEAFTDHILGTVVPNPPPEPGQEGKRQWHTSAEGYTVVGEFKGLPPELEERPMCAACVHMTPAPAAAKPRKADKPLGPPPTAAEAMVENDERMAAAVGLGRRVEKFLATVANPDVEPVGWEELHDDLTQWGAKHGPPAADKPVLALAKAERGPLGQGAPGGAGWLLKAFLGKSATLIEPLAEKPSWMPRYTGNPHDPLQVGEYLFRNKKALTIGELPGKDAAPLFAAGWCEDSTAPAWVERLDFRGNLYPPDDYMFGELWPRLDRARARAALGDTQAAAQATRLLEAIQPATFDEIEVSPQDGFVPLDVLGEWLDTINHGHDALTLVRADGIVHMAGVPYDEHLPGISGLSDVALMCLGWINHDYVVFKPSAKDDDAQQIDADRLMYAREWTEKFRAWLDARPKPQRAVENAYQRARQGYRQHAYGSAPLRLARWNPAVVLNPHQIAGARRVNANRAGGLGFQVGVGKTYTILAALALARQEGRARRPVICAPQKIAFQWMANIKKALPDFRVVVIGINKTKKKTGEDSSDTDSPEERSRKWARFMGGEFDVAVVTYDSLPRTLMDEESTLKFVEGVTAIEREVALRARNAKKSVKGELKRYAEEKGVIDRRIKKLEATIENLTDATWPSARPKLAKARQDLAVAQAKLEVLDKKHLGSLTERQDAILEETVGRFIAEMTELPGTWKPDPDIIWNKIGVDWIAFDEAHNGKNLHMPADREGGSVPKYMGNAGDGSKRAWHWFFRCCDVQSRGGEVVLATATPASNSPLEFYNLVKLMDKDAWTRIGIYDPEAFIDRFCILQIEEVMNAEMEVEQRLACVGFKNADELRSVIYRLWEFKTAKQAGLKLPAVTQERVFVDMDAAQEQKYVDYVKAIEDELSKPKIPGQKSGKILGLLARMAMVSMHSQLDEGFKWKTAGAVDNPHSPKFDALANNILKMPHCGHIVFADYIAAHAWIRDVLVEAGIPADRIGILNAVVAPKAADRLRIAREFNGDAAAGIPPKYDVLISNEIGEEGVDLQDRTCAIHQLDVGWTPKKNDQRIGRGVRQGNTLSNIHLYYYLANRSQDGVRLDMVQGKQNWIDSLLEGNASVVANTAAQSTLSRKDLLVLISRDPEATRKAFEAAEAEAEEKRKVKVAKVATDTLRAAASRFERARTETDQATATELLSAARQKLAGLAKVPPDVWPWAGWAQAAEQAPMLVPKEPGAPVYEGLQVAMPKMLDRSVIECSEFGRIDGSDIGSRFAGAAHWEKVSAEKVSHLHLEPPMRIAEGSGTPWPADDQAGIDKAMQDRWLDRLRHGAGAADAWRALGWVYGPSRWVEAQWSRWGRDVVAALASTGGWAQNLQIPALRRGLLVQGLTPPFSDVLPPTDAGYEEFLRIAPMAGLKFTELENIAVFWWNRGIPRTLLSAGRDAQPQSRAA